MTLFSASRYMGAYDNRGAFLVVEPGLRRNLQQFVAHSMGSVDMQSPAERAAAQKQEVLDMVKQRIASQRHEL